MRLLGLLLLSSSAFAAPADLTGTYKSSAGGTQCVLKVAQLKPNRIRFLLDCERGEDFSGSAAGLVDLAASSGTYRSPSYPDCAIALRFSPGQVKVTQTGSSIDCNFGRDVRCTGTYLRADRRKPRFE